MIYRILTFFLLSFFITSCFQDENRIITLPEFTGAVNEIVVVIDEELWRSSIGDSLQDSFGSDFPGIPWKEPLFDLVQIEPESYTKIFETHRNILIFKPGESTRVGFLENKHARGQLITFFIYANTEELSIILRDYTDTVINKFKEIEMIRRNTESRPDPLLKNLFDKYGVTFLTEEKYNLVLDTNMFSWLEFSPNKKEIIKGVFIYELPFDKNLRIEKLLNARDSVLKRHVHGEQKGSYMALEKEYPPHINTLTSINFPAIEIRGLWKMRNAFMGGPFIAHFIQDTIGFRTLVVEGFLFDPGKKKRNKIESIQAILGTLKKTPKRIEEDFGLQRLSR